MTNTEQISHRRLNLLLLAGIVLAYCAWVLCLPLFPMQDGPMHLYFTHVLHSLITDPKGFYGQFYYIRHLLPPYALYYYLLMFLSSFLPTMAAEKLIICLYIVSFAFGFRYLAVAIGASGDFAALLSTLLLLNWPLGMGFVNFCLSTSFMLWALGLWCRAAGRRDTVRSLLFVFLAYVIMFTHPVPLLALLGFCAIELSIRLIRGWRTRYGHQGALLVPEGWIRDATYLALASASLLYVRTFTTSHIAQQIHVSTQPALQHELSLLKGFILLHSLAAFAGRSIEDLVYRAPLYALLALGIAAAIFQLRRAWLTKTWTLAHTWSSIGILSLLLFPLVPSDLNNSAYFAARLVLYLWIAALLAMSGVILQKQWLRYTIIAATLAFTTLNLVMAQQRIKPIASEIAALESGSPLKMNEHILLMHDPGYKTPSTITYDPYFWSGVRAIRRSNSLLYNTPWLDLAIIPLGPKGPMPTYTLTANDLEYPPGLQKTLVSNASLRRAVLHAVNHAIVSFGQGPIDLEYTQAFLNSGVDQTDQSWMCHTSGILNDCAKRSDADRPLLTGGSNLPPLGARDLQQ